MKDGVSGEKYQEQLQIARKSMLEMGKKEEKVEDKTTVKPSTPPKIQIQPKFSVTQPASIEVRQVDTPATRLANIPKEANKNNNEKPAVLNLANNIS